MARSMTRAPFVSVALALTAAGTAHAADVPLRLTVTTEVAQYVAGPALFTSGLRLHAVLTNIGKTAVFVSKRSSFVCPSTIERNGEPVLVRSGIGEELLREPSDSLVRIDPGGTLDLSVRRLRCVWPAEGWSDRGLLAYRSVSQALVGQHSVVLVYQYRGHDFGHPNVYRGEVISNPVTFEIVPAR
jgi:hypothetical protein